ncbi:MAG: ABC transporter ATP-binding protein [Dysgonomonas sp.]
MQDIISIIRNFTWVFHPLKSNMKRALAIALIMIICCSLITSLIPTLVGKVIDHVLIDERVAYLSIATIGILFLIDIIAEVIRKYKIEGTATQVQKDLIVKSSDRLIHLDIQWLNSQRSGGLNGRIQRSVEGAVSLLKLITMDFLPNILQMIFAMVIACITNIYIGIILLLVSAIGIYIVIRQIHSQKGIRLSLLRAREDNDANIVELLTGIESVRVANEETKQIKRIEAVNENLRNVEMKHHIKMMMFDSIKKVNIVFWNVVILLIGLILASQRIITPGDMVTFNLLFNNILIPLQNIHRFIDEAHEASLKTNDLRDLLDMKEDASYSPIQEKNKIENDSYAASISNLSFSYDDKEILKDVSARFTMGNYYGIVGATGCGKSTLLRLMMNLIHIQKGELKILGKDIQSISREQLSSMIIYMPQTPYIFRGTIRENLLFGSKSEYNDHDLWWALEQVCLSDDIKQLDDQLDFMLNERGSNISGGQRQRVALARVFLNVEKSKHSHIVILDEATSALDIYTEDKVIENLLAIIDKKTTIIAIAHRYTTLKNANEIICMNSGRITQIIDYAHLLEMQNTQSETNA